MALLLGDSSIHPEGWTPDDGATPGESALRLLAHSFERDPPLSLGNRGQALTEMDAYNGSFARFYESHVSRVAIFLYKQGATLDDAWDATQSAFVKLLQNWNEVRTPNAWVRTTAWHEYTTMSQRSARLTERMYGSAYCEPYSEMSEIKLHEEEWEVLNVIALLPGRQRQVVAWYYDGFSCEEIAEVLDITPANARANLYQARKRLRAELPVRLLDFPAPEGGAR